MNLSTKASILASAILLALIAARAYYSFVSGYLLPDEAFYLTTFTMNGGLGWSVYRPILHLFYVLFFSGASSIPGLFVRGALFCSVWAVGSIFILSRILKALEMADKVSALVILSFIIMPVFPLMAVFFVTETMALFFGLAGMYFSIRYVKDGGWKPAALAGLMFLFASQVREPYLLFLVGAPVALLLLRSRSIKPTIAYGIPLLIGLPFPTSIRPLSISQPVSVALFEWLPHAAALWLVRAFDTVKAAASLAQAVVQSAPSWLSHPSSVPSAVSSAAVSVFDAASYIPPSPGSSSSLPGYVVQAANTVHVTLALPEFYAFFAGLALGIGPLMAVLLLASPFFARNRLVAVFALLAMLGFFVTADFAVEYLPDALSLWTSNIIRLSSAALPAGIALGYLYQKAGPRFAYICIVGTLIIGGAMMPSFASAIQSSQNVQGGDTNRLSFSYQASYYRMAQMLQPGDLVLTGSTGIGPLGVYASMLRNVTVLGFPANRSGFDAVTSEKWSHVYLWDDWVSLQNPSFFTACQCYAPYVVSILYSHNVTVLWSDGESYGEVLK